MSSVLKEKHIHTYERSRSNKDVYRCVHPRCTHYHRREFLIGKEAICNECKNPFILSVQQLKNKRPVCDFCTKSPRSAVLRAARDAAFEAFTKQNEVESNMLLTEETKYGSEESSD